MPFVEGFGYGIATVLLIGPVFFTLLKAALEHGARGGIAVAMGIIVSDIVIVVICLTGLVRFVEKLVAGPWMALAAGVMLVGLGLRYIFRPALDVDRPARASGRNMVAHFTSGFLVNFVNPFVFAIWIGLVLHAKAAHVDGVPTFLLGTLSGILLTDIIKALLAPRLKPLLTPAMLKHLHLVIGIAMLLFSIRVFIHAAVLWD